MILLILLFMVSNVFADEIYYDKTNGTILAITKDPMVVSPEDKDKIVSKSLPENFDINTLSKPLAYYNYDGKEIKLNTKKIVDEDNQKVADESAEQVLSKNRSSAIEKLKSTASLTDDEIKAIIK